MANDTVDTRVVRMEFDNKQFEKGIKQTSKSLDNLKDSLDFKGVGDGLDKIKLKISALQIATTTFVVRLTNKLISLGVVMAKSLSVDNIASGWAKFGDKTISVATMMAQKIRIAGEEITDLAKKTEVVNTQLDLLTWFADETSYSFSDMTNYVGKFIAAGQDLDKSVKAMEGIATWAALSGQNSQTASRAMQQLAQAMGRTINRQDWMSIQTANMDTEEFREKVLETAVALGELTKEGNKFVTKTGKKFEKSGFMTYFSEGWFTSDVLVETLNKYSAAVDEIYSISIKEGITATEVLEKYGDQLDEFGVKAFKASQEARTFRDVINSIKDAVASKWMTTFENIFGGKDEAIKLWTELSNRLYDVFAESGNFRNNVLSIWKEFKGRDDIFGENGAFWNMYNAIDSIRILIKKAWDTVFPISEMEDENARAKDIARTLKNITLRIKEFTKNMAASEEVARRIAKAFQLLFSVFKIILVTLKAVRYTLDPIIYTLKQLTNTILSKLINMAGGVDKILHSIEKIANRLRDSIWKVIDILNPRGTLDSFFNFVTAIYNLIKDFKPIERITTFIDELFKSFREGGGTQENLIKIFKGLMSVVSILGKSFIALAQALNKYVLPILDKILIVSAQIIGTLSGVIISIIAAVSEIISSINEALEGNGAMSGIGESFKNLIINIGTSVSKIIPILGSLLSIVSALMNLIMVIPKLLDSISIKLTGRGIVDNLKAFFDSIANIINNFTTNIQNGSSGSGTSGFIDNIFNSLSIFFNGLIEMLKGLIAIGNIVIAALGKAFQIIGVALQKIADVIVKLFTGRAKELSKSQKSALVIIAVLGTLTLVTYLLYSAFYRFMEAINPLGTVTEGVVDNLDRVRLTMLANAIDIFANALLKFAVALAIFDNIKSSTLKAIVMLGAIIAMVAALIYMLKDMKNTTDDFGVVTEKTTVSIRKAIADNMKATASYRMLAKILKTIGLVLIEIAVAALILDKLDASKNTFGKIVLLLTAMLIGVIAIVGIINHYGSIASVSANQIAKSTSSFKDIKAAMAGVIAILFSLIIAMKIMDTVNQSSFDKTMFVFAVVVGSILALIIAIGSFSTLFEKYAGDASKRAQLASAKSKGLSSALKGLSTALLAVAGTVLIISIAMSIVSKSMSKMSESTGGKGSSGHNATLLMPALSIIRVLVTIAGAIIVLIKALKNVSKSKINEISQLMAFFSGTLISIASALSIVASIQSDKLGWAVLSLLGIMAGLSLLMIALSKMKLDSSARNIAVSLAIIAGSLIGFAVAMKTLASTDIGKAAKGLLIIAASLLALAAIAAIAKTLIPVMQALATVLLTVGAAVTLLGTGLSLIAIVVDKLSTSGEKFKAFLSNFAEGMMSFLKIILLGLATLIPQVIIILLDGLGRVIESAINLLRTYFPVIVDTILDLLVYLLQAIASRIDVIVGYVNQILLALVSGSLDFLGQNIVLIFNKIVEIIHNLIEAIIQNLPQIAQDIINLLTAIVKIIATIIPDLIKTLIPAIIDAVFSIIDAIFEALGAKLDEGLKTQLRESLMQALSMVMEVLQMIITIIMEIINALDWDAIMETTMTILQVISRIITALMPVINAIINAVLELINAIDWEQFLGFISKVLNLIASIIEWLAPILAKVIAVVLKVIVNVLSKIFEILDPLLTFIMNALEPIIDFILYIVEILQKLANGEEVDWNKFVELGWNIIKGIAKGIAQAIPKILKGVFEGIGNFFKSIFGIHSPSKVFAGYGKYMIQGLGNGLQDESDKEQKRFSNIAKDTLRTFEDALFNKDGEYDYVMTVGMDISNVEKESAKVQDLMSSISTESKASATAYGYNARKISSSIAASERANAKVDKAAETTIDNSVQTTNNNTFNIKSTDPKEAAKEIDKILQKNAYQAKLAKGGI